MTQTLVHLILRTASNKPLKNTEAKLRNRGGQVDLAVWKTDAFGQIDQYVEPGSYDLLVNGLIRPLDVDEEGINDSEDIEEERTAREAADASFNTRITTLESSAPSTALAEHVIAQTPHTAYDVDFPDLALIWENRIV